MDERTIGLILRTRPLTETSLIVHWLTPDLGRLATVAKGARRAKSPFRGKLDLFYRAEFSFARSRKSDLHILREVSLLNTPAAVRRDLQLLQQAAYCAALIEQTTETETPLPNIYRLLCDLLNQLQAGPPEARTILTFELKLLAELGQFPAVATTSLSPGSRRIAESLRDLSWEALATLKLSAKQVTELSRFLHGFLIHHLGRIPHARNSALVSQTVS